MLVASRRPLRPERTKYRSQIANQKVKQFAQKISYTRKSSTEAIPNADLDDGVVDIAMRKVAKCHQSRELKEGGVNVVLMQSRVEGITK
jgi:hypothetical protein